MQSSRLFIRPKLAKSVSRKREWRILHGQSKLATSSVERNFIFFFLPKNKFSFRQDILLRRTHRTTSPRLSSISFLFVFLSFFLSYIWIKKNGKKTLLVPRFTFERWKAILGNELSVTVRVSTIWATRFSWTSVLAQQWFCPVDHESSRVLDFCNTVTIFHHLSLKLISGRAFPLCAGSLSQIDVLRYTSPISTEWMFNSSVIQPAVRSVTERAIDALIQFRAN